MLGSECTTASGLIVYIVHRADSSECTAARGLFVHIVHRAACSGLARAQEMKMRQTKEMYVVDVPTIFLLTLQNVTTGTNQLPFRPDAKKHRLSTISRSDAV